MKEDTGRRWRGSLCSIWSTTARRRPAGRSSSLATSSSSHGNCAPSPRICATTCTTSHASRQPAASTALHTYHSNGYMKTTSACYLATPKIRSKTRLPFSINHAQRRLATEELQCDHAQRPGIQCRVRHHRGPLFPVLRPHNLGRRIHETEAHGRI